MAITVIYKYQQKNIDYGHDEANQLRKTEYLILHLLFQVTMLYLKMYYQIHWVLENLQKHNSILWIPACLFQFQYYELPQLPYSKLCICYTALLTSTIYYG